MSVVITDDRWFKLLLLTHFFLSRASVLLCLSYDKLMRVFNTFSLVCSRSDCQYQCWRPAFDKTWRVTCWSSSLVQSLMQSQMLQTNCQQLRNYTRHSAHVHTSIKV